MPDDLVPTIAADAAQPASAEADGVAVRAHPLPDKIAADRYVKGGTNQTNKVSGLRFIKVVAPGGY